MHALAHLLMPLASALWLAPPAPGVPHRVVAAPGGLRLGTERGLYRHTPAGWQLELARGAVRDLIATPQGWLAAVADGLYELRAGAPPRAVPLGAGAEVRALARDATGALWAATDAGLYVRAPEAADFVRHPGLPAGAVHAVRAVGERVWVARQRALWVLRAGVFERRASALSAGRWELVGAVAQGDATLLAVPRGLWRIEAGRGVFFERGPGELRALAAAGDVLWLASERGLLRGSRSRPDAPGEVVLEGEAYDVVDGGAVGLLVATRSGVARVRAAVSPRALRRVPPAVDARTVQRAVLAYQGLSPVGIQRLAARARSAAWWPQLRVSASWDRERERDRDRDQVFSTGEVRNLRDRGRALDTGLGLDVQFTWELGRRARPDALIAISRERRELIELRDQVLERVTRLVFERRRVLALHAAAESDARPELELRANELAAQLDAWTGGVFSRLARPQPDPRRTTR